MNLDHLLQNYLSGTLSKEEQIAFENAFENNSDFRKEVEEAIALKNVIFHNKKDILKATFQKIEANKKKKTIFPLKYWMAASVVVLAGTLFMLFNQSPTDSNTLFKEYYEPYKNVVHPIERSGASETENPELKAFQFYDANNYEAGETAFELAYSTEQKPYLLLYQAICALENNNIIKAEQLLNEHQKHNDEFKNQNKWYLALLYLKTNRTSQAIILLTELASSDFKSKQAIELLNKIK